jgi:hypothetical protein
VLVETERESRRERESFIKNYPWRIGGGSTEQRKTTECERRADGGTVTTNTVYAAGDLIGNSGGGELGPARIER